MNAAPTSVAYPMLNEQNYLDLLYHIRHEGKDRPDRTGTGVRGGFGHQVLYDLRGQFPLWTTRKLNFETALSEMLWFLEGSGDERRLAEIRFGKPRAALLDKSTIWTANANADYWNGAYPGHLGRVYGVQWRHWQNYIGETTDQIATLVEGLRRDPYGRRHVLTAWNPGELKLMALPPCHLTSTFYVEDGELSCMLFQRSNDLFLGTSANVPSYALLTYMLAQVCGLKPGDLVHAMADCHIYANHFDAVDAQLARTPTPAPRLVLDPAVTEIDDFTMASFTLEGYAPQPPIRAPMAV